MENKIVTLHKKEEGDVALLSSEVKQQIDHWIKKFPVDRKQSALLPALTIVQNANEGWLSKPLMAAVAAYLDIPAIAAYEAASFYSMYELKPVGKNKICVCTNLSCSLMGGEDVVKRFEDRLGIKMGETTADGNFTLKPVECLGACVNGPCCMVGEKYHEGLNPEKVDALISELS